MGKTIRREPSHGMWFRRIKHVSFRKAEEAAIDQLIEQLLIPSNRHSSFSSRIRNPWDDIIVSYYRGQKWGRKYK